MLLVKSLSFKPMKDKRAVLGLDTAKLFVLALLALILIIIVSFVVINNISELGNFDKSGNLYNASTTIVVNETGAFPTPLADTIQDCEMTIVEVEIKNGTDINSTYYTVTGCSIACNGCEGNFNNSVWYINASYTFAGDPRNIYFNISEAGADLAEDAGTWFTLIGVVIIILIIAVVIIVVNRFGGGSGRFDTGDLATGRAGGGGKLFGGGSRGGPYYRERQGSPPAPNI